MISNLARTAFVALAAAMGSAFAAAPTVTVTFTDPLKFTDAANQRFDIDANMKALAQYLQKLGQRDLAPDRTLSIEITDVDLAGEVRPARRNGQDLRIVRGGADWPRIELRYSLESGGKVLQSGDARIADMNYLANLGAVVGSDPLRHEKAMLNDWFKATFAAAK